MNFKEAYVKMLEGKKIARPCFKGYWYINGVNGKLTIHLASEEEVTEGLLDTTVRNCLADDWMVLPEATATQYPNQFPLWGSAGGTAGNNSENVTRG
jgi:hypothetical protein